MNDPLTLAIAIVASIAGWAVACLLAWLFMAGARDATKRDREPRP